MSLELAYIPPEIIIKDIVTNNDFVQFHVLNTKPVDCNLYDLYLVYNDIVTNDSTKYHRAGFYKVSVLTGKSYQSFFENSDNKIITALVFIIVLKC